MIEKKVNAKPILPNQSGRCLDRTFLASLLRVLVGIFSEYGDRINFHEDRIIDCEQHRMRSWAGF